MKLVCPSCGAVCSAESWQNDETARKVMARIAALPSSLGDVALPYLSLFRPGKRALTWKKALRLVTEINQLVKPGHIQVKGKVARPCPPRIWAAAMEQMVERRDSLNLPMPNHNYLRQIVWELADQEDAEREKRSGKQSHRPAATITKSGMSQVGEVIRSKPQNPMEEYIQGYRDDKPTKEEMDEYRKKRMNYGQA